MSPTDSTHAAVLPAVPAPQPPPAAAAPAAPTAGPPAPPLLWGKSSLRSLPSGVPWLWQGYLAPGALTLLTSQWKAGKTTLVSVLLARLGTGGTLAGLPLGAGNAVVV